MTDLSTLSSTSHTENPTSPPAETTQPTVSAWRGRIVVLAGIILVALNARLMVAVVSPITDLILGELPLTTSDEGLIGLAAPLCFAAFGAISPALGRRYGLEAMMIASLVITSIGEAARALATSPSEFLWWTVPSLAGAGIGNIITPPLIKKYFPDRLGLVTALYTTFATLSTSLPPLFILNIALATGWRFSMGIWAAVGVLGVIPWIAVVFSSDRAGARLAAIKRRLDPRTPVVRPPKLPIPLWRSPMAWSLMLVFSINSIIGYTMFAWLPAMLRDTGQSGAEAAFNLAAFTVGSLPGALIMPFIITRMRRTWILPPIFFLGYAIGFLGLTLSPGEHTLVWMILTRLGDCFFPYVMTMINLKTRSTRGSIGLSGFVQTIGYTIATVGPWGFGLLNTWSGGWHLPMVAMLVLLPLQLVVGIIVAFSRPIPA
ncbi:MAG: MFS transporter [Propionibacteriaceae bacterium]|jgi:CP family cyanate transporter-like MFS transporter|nr:MFS transporter [Propionibacteriaceae bacterium]